jgi:hypothetical protein
VARAPTDNLPREVDSFVGRQAELAAMEGHFDGDNGASDGALDEAANIADSQADPLAPLIVRLFRGACEAQRGHRAGGATGNALLARAEQRLLEATTPPQTATNAEDPKAAEAPAADSSELRAAARVLAVCVGGAQPA